MTRTSPARSTALPPLPHWEAIPDDLPAAIRTIKHALQGGIAASGRTVEEVFAVMEARVRAEVADIAAAKARGETVWPVIDYTDIAAGSVSAEQLAYLHRRGCLVVRGHFDRDMAAAWDRDIVDYVDSNRFFEKYRGPGDDFFGSVGSKPEIYPIYWSQAQMQARQSDRMATVQGFLNHQWRHESDGVQWFDPDRDSLYPDRIRRRPEGANSNGLGTHLDPGTLDLWMTQAYQQAFRHLFDGTVEHYDPWDASHRTAGPQYPGSTMCSAFRTFQGWTALSDMDHDQGVLHTVPILEALSGIPDVKAGDSVWWHADMIHSVAPIVDQQGWGNVMYIPAAPWCPRNEKYAASVLEAFRTGSSPGDFPEEHYERQWSNRFQETDLNETGR